MGAHTPQLERKFGNGHVMILKPEGEGDGLPLDAHYFCVAGEDIRMRTFSFKSFGGALSDERFEAALAKLTGAAK